MIMGAHGGRSSISAPTGSIGDIAVSPSNPDVIYVGSGEGLHRPDLGVGDGIFKSTRRRQRGSTSVSPTFSRSAASSSTRRIQTSCFVAGMGHPFGPNDERGIFRTARWRPHLGEGALRRPATPAADRSSSMSRTQPSSTRRSGIIAKHRGRTATSPERTAACTSPPTAGRPGEAGGRTAGRRARPRTDQLRYRRQRSAPHLRAGAGAAESRRLSLERWR